MDAADVCAERVAENAATRTKHCLFVGDDPRTLKLVLMTVKMEAMVNARKAHAGKPTVFQTDPRMFTDSPPERQAPPTKPPPSSKPRPPFKPASSKPPPSSKPPSSLQISEDDEEGESLGNSYDMEEEGSDEADSEDLAFVANDNSASESESEENTQPVPKRRRVVQEDSD